MTNLDSEFEQVRNSLEFYFRHTINKKSKDSNDILKVSNEHGVALKKLRLRYEEVLHDIEMAYVDALKLVD